MKVRAALLCAALSVFGYVNAKAQENTAAFLALCYHDIPREVNLDNYGVDRASLVEQIEYLRSHGYTFVGMDDIRKANKNEKPLPENAVLLTFDDAYLSFYEFVFPLLKAYGYPCNLAVVTSWIDNPPPDLKQPLMSWEQLREVSESSLVEIASHSHLLHRGVRFNPQGNQSWAATSRIYDPATKSYESEDDFRRRIRDDLTLSRAVLKDTLGIDVRVMVWPYGQNNAICVEEAEKAGFDALFSLEEKFARADNLLDIPRCLVKKNPAIGEFLHELKKKFFTPAQYRIMQADLDMIYDPDSLQQERNLDRFIERVFNMRVNAVYLQAFSDSAGTGNISSVYFPNRVLPVRADVFSRVVNQLFIREISVYAWMPMLSIVLPDREETGRLRVREFKGGEKRLSGSWYQRLSPFSPAARQKLVMLYEDVAKNARISGVVFQDDGYLNDFEDFHPDALREYTKISGGEDVPFQQLSPDKKNAWTALKTKMLIDLTDTLKQAVRRHRPYALFARTLYAPVLTEPESEEWFAQNYAESLNAYDYVIIMAYPLLEKVDDAKRWLRRLVQEARGYPGGLQKTVFKVQTYDWERSRWIGAETVDSWLRALVSSGARHVAYYPDDYVQNEPDDQIIRLMMSVEDFPFKRIRK